MNLRFDRLKSVLGALAAALAVSVALGSVLTAQSPSAGSPAPTAAGASLKLYASDFVYEGAFRVPTGSVTNPPTSDVADTLSYGGHALAFNPAGDGGAGSVFMIGHVYGQKVVELSIPSLVNSTSLASLNTASVVQAAVEATNGHYRDVTSFSGDSVMTGGLLAYGDELLQSFFIYYDGLGAQSTSHFRRPLTLTAAGGTGPFQLGATAHRAGFYSGYMGQIPADWQAALGGKILVGNCCLSIISRTSYGPGVFATDPADFAQTPVPLVYYPSTHQGLGLGADGEPINPNFSVNSTQVSGVVFVPGTSTVLFFGRHGVGDSCYGLGTPDASLHRQPVPGGAPIEYYCFDPVNTSKGGHGYPYKSYVWAYDANEFLLVRAGTKQPWDVMPYAVWPLDLPFATGLNSLEGATYDPATGRLFVSQGYSDASNPVVHAFTLSMVPPVAANITGQPANVAVTVGQTAQFTVTAGGSPAPTFQWQQSSDSGTTFTTVADGSLYSGATSTTLTASGAPLSLNGTMFRVVVSNAGGSVTSSAATLTVVPAGFSPSISTQPVDKTITEWQTATFTVTADGSPVPTYRWQRSPVGGTTFTDVAEVAPWSGTTTSTLTITAAGLGRSGTRYRVVVTNASGSVTSTAATFTVVPAAPSISAQPADKTIVQWQSATFTVTASGPGVLTYQWQRSPVGATAFSNVGEAAPWSGTTLTTLTITGAGVGRSGTRYRVVVSNAGGSATSAAATFTVTTGSSQQPAPRVLAR